MKENRIPRDSIEAIRVGQKDILDKYGIRFLRTENGEADSEVDLQLYHRNFYGVPYGGVLFNLADNTAGMAFLSAGGNGVTITGNVNYLRGASSGTTRLTCHAAVRKSGRKLFFIDAEVKDDGGNLLSTYSFVFTNIAEENQS